MGAEGRRYGGACRPGTPTRCAVPGQRQDGACGAVVSWFVLIVSGLFEAVWATALGRSDGLSRLVPTVVFFAALIVSMAGLAHAMREITTGTAYVVWVGIGAVATVAYGMLVDTEPISVARVLLLLGIVGCVGGLRVLD